LNQQVNIQDKFLHEIKINDCQVEIFLINGYKMSGKIVNFDNFVIILKTEDKEMLIYKHAISTIIPSLIIKI